MCEEIKTTFITQVIKAIHTPKDETLILTIGADQGAFTNEPMVSVRDLDGKIQLELPFSAWEKLYEAIRLVGSEYEKFNTPLGQPTGKEY